ncbi:MAG: glycosyltransferase family 39 protein, partial [Patescibacteria group bacterium]
MKQFNISKISLLILLPLAVIFFIAYSYLAYAAFWQNIYFGRPIFNSPDETSNYFFSQMFAGDNTFKFYDDSNGPAEGLVTPRSMRVIAGYTVPASFIGLPLIFGAISKLTGLDYLPFFTPLFSVLGVLFFYLLVKELFNRYTALIAAIFAFIVPAWWYYSAKGMMPNALFISFFIITL